MADDLVLYGYEPSSYVFSVRMLLAEKGVSYRSVPLDVIAGEPQSDEHRKRHPFGKVPVLECDGFRIIETNAILRYVNDAFEGPSFIPGSWRAIASRFPASVTGANAAPRTATSRRFEAGLRGSIREPEAERINQPSLPFPGGGYPYP